MARPKLARAQGWSIRLRVLTTLLLILPAGCCTARVPIPPAAQPDPGLTVAQRTKVPGENPARMGFADYHAHMFSDLSFGQLILSGKAYPREPASPDAMANSLATCDHLCAKHFRTKVGVGALEPKHKHPDGYPTFKEWPRYDTHVHQQMYIDWLYRSYQYGLRLVSVVATNNEALCGLVDHPGPCNDMDVVDAQIKEIERMASYEHEWMQIAYSATDADNIIRSNKLAVVIGIEVDTLFDCSISPERRCSCTRDQVKKKVEDYYTDGVRQIIPIHMADNGFGGNAIYKEVLASSHYLARRYYADYYDCFEDDVRWTLRGSKGIPLEAQVVSFLTQGRVYCPSIRETKAEGHCNALGLTSDCGSTLIREMMRHGMLIDLQHMSQRTTDDTLAIAEANQYPVMLSHTWFRDLKLARERIHFADLNADNAAAEPWDEQKSEMHSSAETLRRVSALGGTVGILTNQGPLELPPSLAPFAVPNNCDGSSRSFAQALIYADEVLQLGSGVGFGTDVNGLAGQPGPRFGDDACSAAIFEAERKQQMQDQNGERKLVLYDGTQLVYGNPLTRSVAGTRSFDINTDGVAHFGMLPDFIADLEVSGIGAKEIDTLNHSAQAYVTMWRKAETAKSRLSY